MGGGLRAETYARVAACAFIDFLACPPRPVLLITADDGSEPASHRVGGGGRGLASGAAVRLLVVSAIFLR